MVNTTTVKTEMDDNGHGNGSDKPKGCPPGMKKDADGKCVANETFKEDDNAGDSSSKGTGTLDTTLPPPETPSVHECPPGSTWQEDKGCVPGGNAGDVGGGTDGPTTSGKESLETTYKLIEKLMAQHTQYNEGLLKEFANISDKQVEAFASKLGKPTVSKESASFGVKREASSQVDNSGKDSVYEQTVAKPAAFFESAAKGVGLGEGFTSWTINPEAYFSSLKKGWMNYSGPNGATGKIPALGKTVGTEAFTISGGDMPQIFSKQVYVVPGGRMRVPIRQFLDTQIITDADRFNWYTVNSFAFDGSQVEGTVETQESQTITKVTATPALVRALQLVNYADVENAPFDLIEAFNRAAALGSIDAEATDVLDTVYNAITPTNWVDENGVVITEDDTTAPGTATQEMIIHAARLIQEQGGDTAPGNLVEFIHPKGLAELIADTTAEFWAGNQGGQTSTLMTASMGVLENRFGMDIVPTNQVHAQDNTTNDVYRHVMIIKGSIGLAVAADLQIEAQRRPDLSALYVGARHRIKGAVIDETMTTRQSTSQ